VRFLPSKPVSGFSSIIMVHLDERVKFLRHLPPPAFQTRFLALIPGIAQQFVRKMFSFYLSTISQRRSRDRNLLLAEVMDCTISWLSKLCSSLFHITPAQHNNISHTLIPFVSLHNSQLALNGDCFHAQLPPNSYRRPRLGSNNGSGDIRDGAIILSYTKL